MPVLCPIIDFMIKMLKVTIPIVIVIAVISGILYIAKMSENVPVLDLFRPEKFTIIKNVNITGKEGENKAWRIKADECWSGRDKNKSVFENVSYCAIFEDGYPVVKGLTARRIIVNSRNKDIEVFRNVDGKGWLTAKIDFNRANNKEDYSTLFADYIRFNPDTEKGIVKDNILILKEDLTIEAREVSLDLDKNIAIFSGEPRFRKGGDLMIGKTATSYLDKDQLDISSIEVYQENKMAFADAGLMDDANRVLTLKGHVRAVVEKAEEALKKGSIDKISESETKRSLQEKTVTESDQMVLNFDNKNFTAQGNVIVTQKGKKARSDFAEYDEDSENIIMTGNVYMERENGWIKTKKIIVSVKDETFHAMGDVETEFMITK